jgi:hypothetical protein
MVVAGSVWVFASHAATTVATPSPAPATPDAARDSLIEASNHHSFKICTTNGNPFCLGDHTLNAGDHIVQKPSSDARNITLQFIDNNCTALDPHYDCSRFYLKFYNGDVMRTTDNCNGFVNVGGPNDSTGVVWWVNVTPSGTVQFQNQHCPNGGGSVPTVLLGDNTFNNAWEIAFKEPGWYWNFTLYQN